MPPERSESVPGALHVTATVLQLTSNCSTLRFIVQGYGAFFSNYFSGTVLAQSPYTVSVKLLWPSALSTPALAGLPSAPPVGVCRRLLHPSLQHMGNRGLLL